MTSGQAWLRAGLVVGVVLALDQFTKALVRAGVERGDEDPFLPGLKLVNVRNEGVAFGIDAGGQTGVIVLIAVALLALVLYFARHVTTPLIWLPTGLLLGGALGNIVDRIRLGYVVDYADLHFGEFRPFLVFNVADAAITIGVLLLLVRALLMRDGKPPKKEVDHA